MKTLWQCLWIFGPVIHWMHAFGILFLFCRWPKKKAEKLLKKKKHAMVRGLTLFYSHCSFEALPATRRRLKYRQSETFFLPIFSYFFYSFLLSFMCTWTQQTFLKRREKMNVFRFIREFLFAFSLYFYLVPTFCCAPRARTYHALVIAVACVTRKHMYACATAVLLRLLFSC